MKTNFRFNLKKHPNITKRRPDLDPYQKGLFKETKSYKLKKEAGDKFEKKVAARIIEAFPSDYLMNDVYFETGNYCVPLLLYESMQFDHILLTPEGIFCIEDKWISNDYYKSISGGALSKSWVLTTYRGTKTSEPNGRKQNYGHKLFLEELFEYNGMSVPVYVITVIGNLSRDKIKVQQYIDDNLIDDKEIIKRIAYIRINSLYKSLDVKKASEILQNWQCKDEAVRIHHIVYLRNKKKKTLPIRCKKKLRNVE
ncbi:MAG: NERD domain-containing protein [Anaerovibrio sp.]|uniref:nuclease-related domain-containing protein n=1 Tax=Anaerovibrio sp. TaxID=1872532 RepID=UPI0025C04BF0|nr:nuclease-related domain-containing protein [Anaerovibrio sp.]MBE6100470.1 NERD domain-containing protein [Anaerovibrio sp.]